MTEKFHPLIGYVAEYHDVRLVLFYWTGQRKFECLYWKNEDLIDRQVDSLDAIRMIATLQWLIAWDTLEWLVIR